MDAHRVAELRSIAYHSLIAQRLRAGEATVEQALERCRSWAQSGRVHPRYVACWIDALTGPLDELCQLLVRDDDDARALRQCTPFAGYLEPRERWRLWREVRERHA